MVEITEQLLSLYSAKIDTEGDTYTIEVPKREVDIGRVTPGETHRIAILDPNAASQQHDNRSADRSRSNRSDQADEPPVDEGDVIDVKIESLGEQGDGIAKVGPGYVVIIPDVEIGEQVSVRITDITPTVAFAEVVERHEPPTV